jgi:type I restriction enzyme S subunit
MEGTLPAGWQKTTIGEIVTRLTNGCTAAQTHEPNGIPVTRIETISNEVVNLERVKYAHDLDEATVEKYRLLPGDILFSNINSGSSLGKTAVFKGHDSTVLHGMNLLLLRLRNDVDSSFLFYQLKYLRHEGYFMSIAQHAVNQASINQTKLRAVAIGLPKLPEQRRIVSAIETQLGRLDAAVARLHAAKAQLKRYKQAVLKAAIEEAAEEPNAESVVLADVADLCLGKMLDRQKNVGTPHPYLRNINVRWGAFETEDLHQMPFKDSEHERYGLIKGDLVMCEGGEPGRCAVWDGSIPDMKIQKALHRIRCSAQANPHFVVFNFLSACWLGTIDKYYTGTTIKHLTGKMLARFEMVLPPIKEQRRLVARIQEAFGRTEEMESTLDAQLEQSTRLRQAVLKRAFEGRLV